MYDWMYKNNHTNHRLVMPSLYKYDWLHKNLIIWEMAKISEKIWRADAKKCFNKIFHRARGEKDLLFLSYQAESEYFYDFSIDSKLNSFRFYKKKQVNFSEFMISPFLKLPKIYIFLHILTKRCFYIHPMFCLCTTHIYIYLYIYCIYLFEYSFLFVSYIFVLNIWLLGSMIFGRIINSSWFLAPIDQFGLGKKSYLEEFIILPKSI